MRRFVRDLGATGDEAAILRTSGGSTRDRPLTSNLSKLEAILDATEPLSTGFSPQTCATAAWSAVSYAVTGLAYIRGRKTIVLLADNVPAPGGNAASAIEHFAGGSMTAIYETAASAPIFAATTAGDAGITLDRVSQETRFFYVLAVPVAPGAIDVKVRRPGVTLRSRRRSSDPPVPAGMAEPPVDAEALQAALYSPFEGSGIGVQATTLFTNTAAEGTIIEALCHIDTRNLSYLRDEQGRYHLAFEAGVQGVPEAGRVIAPQMGSKELHLTAEEYKRTVEDGLVVILRLTWGSGARDVRVVVADGRSGRMGTANVFTLANSVESGNLFLSGIGLTGGAGVKQGPAVRVFRPGANLSYVYNIFNAAVDAEGRSRLQVQSRLVAGGREAFTGKPAAVTFEPAGDVKRRQVNGRIQLDPSIGPGRYVFLVTVVDQVSPQPRTASHFIDFTVEP
jgi:hypothetical protein